MLNVSPYKLEMYLNCPRQYRFEYIDKWKNLYHLDTPPLVIGSLIHAVLNHYYRHLKPKERTLEKLREIFKEKFLDHQKRKDPRYLVFNKNQVEINSWVQKSVQQLANFFNSPLAKKEPFLTPEELSSFKIPEYGIKLLCKLDRVDKGKKGLEIVDYKTGKLWDQGKDSFQLDFYHLILSYLQPEHPVSKKIYFYLDENKQVEVPIKKQENVKTLEKIIKTAEQIQMDKEFVPKENPMCRFCDYKIICPLFKDKMSDKERAEIKAKITLKNQPIINTSKAPF